MGRYYKIVLSFVLAIFMMTNTIFAYGEKSLNIINITHLFKQIQQIKFAQLESSTLQSQYKFDLSENTMDKKLVKITIPNLQDTKNKSIKDYSTLANNTQQTKEAEKEDTEELSSPYTKKEKNKIKIPKIHNLFFTLITNYSLT